VNAITAAAGDGALKKEEYTSKYRRAKIKNSELTAKTGDEKETIYGIAVLSCHVIVLMIRQGISLEEIHREAPRHIIDHNVRQEKMTRSHSSIPRRPQPVQKV